jgi:hypothetical protein
MAEFPYTQSPKNIKKLFEEIQNVGIPSKVNTKWIESIGLKTKSDRRLPGILKFLGFVDGLGAPTQLWKDYRDKTKSKVVLAQSMRASYTSLFAMYPDAQNKDDSALTNFFSSNTNMAAVMVGFIVNTFKGLKSLADFAAEVPDEVEVDVEEIAAKKEQAKTGAFVPLMKSPELNVNVQIHISADATKDQIDKIFESMGKHLFKR